MLLFKKEKEVLELIQQHVDKVHECLVTADAALKAYIRKELQTAKGLARKTDGIESEADMIRHAVRDKLYSGAYMPLLREDIYKLVESLDTVANAAEKCCDVFLNQRPVIPDFISADFLEIVSASMQVAAPLRESVLCFINGICPTDVSRQSTKELGLVESKVDRMEWDLTKKISSSTLDYSHKLHLRHCLDQVVAISDRAEDSADQLELVIFKAMV